MTLKFNIVMYFVISIIIVVLSYSAMVYTNLYQSVDEVTKCYDQRGSEIVNAQCIHTDNPFSLKIVIVTLALILLNSYLFLFNDIDFIK